MSNRLLIERDSSNSSVIQTTGTSTGLGRVLVKEVVRRGDYVIASARKIESIKDLETNTGDEDDIKQKGTVDILVLSTTGPKAIIFLFDLF